MRSWLWRNETSYVSDQILSVHMPAISITLIPIVVFSWGVAALGHLLLGFVTAYDPPVHRVPEVISATRSSDLLLIRNPRRRWPHWLQSYLENTWRNETFWISDILQWLRIIQVKSTQKQWFHVLISDMEPDRLNKYRCSCTVCGASSEDVCCRLFSRCNSKMTLPLVRIVTQTLVNIITSLKLG